MGKLRSMWTVFCSKLNGPNFDFYLAVLSLLIGIPLGTNASMSVESFLPKRNSNNGNTFQWKHDLKRKVSQMH